MKTKILDKNQITEVVSTLNHDGIVAVPTDTVYGFAVRYDRPQAIEKLKKLKGRDSHKPFPFLAGSCEQIETIATLKERDYKLIARCLPSAVTFLFSKHPSLADSYTLGLPTIAVRMLADSFFEKVLTEVGCPLLLTSANFSNQPECLSSDEVLSEFDGKIEAVVTGHSLGNKPSTIIDASQSTLKVIRQGEITLDSIIRKVEEA